MKDLTTRRIWFAVFVLAVFSVGLTAGIALDRYLIFARRPAFARGGGPGPFGGPGLFGNRRPSPTDIADRLARELDLNGDQERKLEEILTRGTERMEAFQSGNRRQFDGLRQQLDAEISAILTPEQRAKFEKQQEKRRRERPRPGGSGPGVPPGPPR